MKHKPDQAFGHWEVFCFFLAIPKTDPLSRPTCSSRLGRAAAADRRRRFFFAIAVRGERWSSGVRGRTTERSARRRRRWTESAAVGRRRARAASYGGHRQQRGKFCSDSGRRSTAGLLYRHETGSRERFMRFAPGHVLQYDLRLVLSSKARRVLIRHLTLVEILIFYLLPCFLCRKWKFVHVFQEEGECPNLLIGEGRLPRGHAGPANAVFDLPE